MDAVASIRPPTGHHDAALYHLERAYQASCIAYDAATLEQRAMLDAHPEPVFKDGDWASPHPSAVRSLLRRFVPGRREP